MNFEIDKNIFRQYQDLKIGLVRLTGLDNSRRISATESLLRGISAQRQKEFKDNNVLDSPMIQPWDRAFVEFGVNPLKIHNSLTALIKKVRLGKEVVTHNPLIDLCNYFSLKYMLPVAVKDLDWLCGDLRLIFTEGDEVFRPEGSIEISRAKGNEVAYRDKGGIVTRYFNGQNCERTKITKKTCNALIIVEDLSKMHMDIFGQNMNEITQSLNKYLGAMAESIILNEESSPVDLGIEGRRMADDSKIPQQEVAFYMSNN